MDTEANATLCSVCQEIYIDPRCLACGHSFCLICIKGLASNNQRFPCPLCRFDVDLQLTNVDQLPRNFVLSNVIEALVKKQQSMCSDHNKSLDLFCQRCDVVICSKCLTMQHKGHAIQDIEIVFIERSKQYGACLERTRHLVLMTEEKRDAVKQLKISMEKNIDSISKTVENTFKKWNDALQKQHNGVLSYLHQERDQKRHMFVKAERILEGLMTTLTGLDNEISNLKSKDTAYVVQQYESIMARQKDTERKVVQDIETCFTPPDILVLEVYAPWIEEAIKNIKLIDMKQTKARSERMKIAEIQEENFILKRLRMLR
ncbi:hypothetical protein ACJMK2_031553 [Sinanodonta woodiana]|uniref:Uncharacterized protein n=1 Tax=Sinanodonta woodiana TaxID=1069815 RepID=A0ABD3X2N7_SINWO